MYNPQKKRLQTGAKGYKIVTFCAWCWEFLPKLEEKSAPPENGSFFVQPAKSSFENSSQTPENPPFSPGKSAFFRIFKELLCIFAYNFNFSAEFPFFLPPRTAELPPHCRGFSVSICRKPPSFTGKSASADHSDAPAAGFRSPRRFPLHPGGFRCASVVSAAPRWFPLHPGGFRCNPAVPAAPRRFPLCCGGFLRRSCLSARKCARFCLSGKETIAAGECQSRRHKIKSPGRCTHLPGDFVVL